MPVNIRRRELIAGLGGWAATWPLAARAQQPERMRRIGVLMHLLADDPEGQARHAAFLQGLQQVGWSAGRNVRIDTRWAASEADRRRYAGELVALAPDVMLASNSTTTAALQSATRIVPIVFSNVTDPVAAGFVESLARPGGNATGFSLFEYGISAKWLELLKEIAPGMKRAAVVREFNQPRRDRPVRRDPIGGSVPWGGGEPDRRARRQRDRTCCCGSCAFPRWRLDRDGKRVAGK